MCLAQGLQHSDAGKAGTPRHLGLKSSTLPLSHSAPLEHMNVSKQLPMQIFLTDEVSGPQISVHNCTYFLIPQSKHMFWVLKRNVSMRRSFEHPKHMFKPGFALGFIFLSPPFSPIRFFLCHFLELRARFWPIFRQKRAGFGGIF